jgi:O-methyltransferase
MVVPTLLHPQAIDELLNIAASAPPGNFAEFGVYKGGAAQYLADVARVQKRKLYLFDTFTGIPFAGPHDHHQVGDFADTSEEAVHLLIPDAVICPGMFPTPEFLRIRDQFAFVHVDADQYDSLRAAIKCFPSRMVPGGLILFDDYGCLPGATRAVQEWGQPFELTRNGKALWRKPQTGNQ